MIASIWFLTTFLLHVFAYFQMCSLLVIAFGSKILFLFAFWYLDNLNANFC